MLKEIKENDYVILKLSSGEEVLGKLKTIEKDSYVINKPRVITVQPDQSGNPNMMLIPYIQLSEDNEVSFNKLNVITMVSLNEEMKNEYIRLTSGLVMANHMPV